jgi:cytochrome c
MLTLGASASADETIIGLGMPLGEDVIERYSITQFPDGRNLPEGSGSAAQGEAMYAERCALCHGEDGDEGPAARLSGDDGFFSFSDPLRILRIRKYPLLVLSVGAQWPYATTIFDYTRRAMPHYAPKSLTSSELYALTAYILYLNSIVAYEDRLDAQSLPEIIMPGASRTVLAWPAAQ